MNKLWSSGALLIVLATSTVAQVPLIATAPPADYLFRGAAAQSAQPRAPSFLAAERLHADTAGRKSRRRQVIGAAIGAVVGALPGGFYAFQEPTGGCKDIPCEKKPPHLWVYPVGGAAVGAVLGALIARF